MSVKITSFGNGYNYLSTVIQNEKGEHILCSNKKTYMSKLTDATALIESEMNDRDSQPIEITGYQQEKKFIMSSVSTNGYRINFNKD